MGTLREVHLSGLDAMRTQTQLLQRVRTAHPTAGLYEAAELEFWWGVERSTDVFPQLFWFEDDGDGDAGVPVASVTVTDFGDGTSLVYDEPTMVVSVLPDATPEWITHVVERGLAHISDQGIAAIELEVDRDDQMLRELLLGRGFVDKGGAVVECWLDADNRPPISPLGDGYRLRNRTETAAQPHHLARPGRTEVEARLGETSLYRADLDLVVLDSADEPAAWGLFWFDPVTSTGVVEPMRTVDTHQGSGLARHILTAGVDLLARAGAERVSIGYEPDNPVSGHLYRSVGFVPAQQTDLFAGPTATP